MARGNERDYNEADNKRLTLENVRIICRNFSGAPDPWNERPTPSFGVVLDEHEINVGAIENDDWYVRRLKAKVDDPEQYRQPWIKVNLKMDGKNPPNVELIRGRKRFKLDQKTIGQLDFVRIKSADCVIRSYRYDPKKPMSAWLIDLRVIASDLSDLDSKYADIPLVGENEDVEKIPFD